MDTRDPDIDNEGGAGAATAHLLGHGHSNVAFIGGPRGLAFAQLRRRGWSRVLKDAGVPARQQVSATATYTRQGGYDAARRLLARPQRPTAILAFNDEQAFGVLRAAAEAGLDVPSELAVFGFDATQGAQFTNPQLSTVRNPLGQLAARIVARVLAPQEPTSSTPLPFELILRESCGC